MSLPQMPRFPSSDDDEENQMLMHQIQYVSQGIASVPATTPDKSNDYDTQDPCCCACNKLRWAAQEAHILNMVALYEISAFEPFRIFCCCPPRIRCCCCITDKSKSDLQSYLIQEELFLPGEKDPGKIEANLPWDEKKQKARRNFASKVHRDLFRCPYALMAAFYWPVWLGTAFLLWVGHWLHNNVPYMKQVHYKEETALEREIRVWWIYPSNGALFLNLCMGFVHLLKHIGDETIGDRFVWPQAVVSLVIPVLYLLANRWLLRAMAKENAAAATLLVVANIVLVLILSGTVIYVIYRLLNNDPPNSVVNGDHYTVMVVTGNWMLRFGIMFFFWLQIYRYHWLLRTYPVRLPDDQFLCLLILSLVAVGAVFYVLLRLDTEAVLESLT